MYAKTSKTNETASAIQRQHPPRHSSVCVCGYWLLWCECWKKKLWQWNNNYFQLNRFIHGERVLFFFFLVKGCCCYSPEVVSLFRRVTANFGGYFCSTQVGIYPGSVQWSGAFKRRKATLIARANAHHCRWRERATNICLLSTHRCGVFSSLQFFRYFTWFHFFFQMIF